ncbi:hypothetical protein FTV88_1555 [Heliorestis convoluta]|uniref:Uncharacterized protein n=1 Tax=Heliorestis convoluta TaxID=356322 RepID=A0A5Q2N4Z7_9FIRM|nr:hypothetical protein FTV88_1555 [Heliorestis convoluta]
MSELMEMYQAYVEEEKRQWEMEYDRTAWFVSHIMNASGNYKRPITPDKLLNKAKDSNPRVTIEERQATLKELQAKFQKTANQ